MAAPVRDRARFGDGPLSLYSARGYAKCCPNFLDREARKVSQLDDLSLHWVECREPIECFVEREDIDTGFGSRHIRVEGGDCHTAATLVACVRPGVIDQDSSHHCGGHGNKVCAVPPLNAIDLDQAQVRLINQRRRLERVTGVLPAHVVVGEPMQLVVQNREQRICRRRIYVRISHKVGSRL
jgi:hypothetical protein